MLHGIDISNWQKRMTVPERIDFCIVKATEGFRYVDPCCDGFVQQCRRKGILFGFYHFARNNEPEQEATFFWEHTKGYVREGIPVLDIEDEKIQDWGDYAQRFVDKYHAITGVYPVVYCSASRLARFTGYPLVDLCGLWVAGYPDDRERGLNDVPRFPYNIAPWKFAAMWQYTNNGWVSNWDEPIDMDVAWMDSAAWHKYANPEVTADTTQLLEIPGPAPEQIQPTWTLENSHVRVDVTLKGKED